MGHSGAATTGIQQAEISPETWRRLISAGSYGEAKEILNHLPAGWKPPAEVKAATSHTRPLTGEDERWISLIGSSEPSDVEEAIRLMGEAQNLSPSQIEAQIESYRKRRGR
jgi:hypothetical protein